MAALVAQGLSNGQIAAAWSSRSGRSRPTCSTSWTSSAAAPGRRSPPGRPPSRRAENRYRHPGFPGCPAGRRPPSSVTGQRQVYLTARETRGESMSRLKKIAEIPAGSWTKWVVVGFWVVVLVLAFPLSKKLTGAEKNDAKYWLPGAAESTKVLNVQARFQSPNVITGVVVYERASGLTAADRAKAAADARRFAGIPGVVPGTVVGPIPSADGKAHPDHPPGQPGLAGLGRRDQARRCHPRDHQLEPGRPGFSHHRPARERVRQQQCVQGHQRHAAVVGRGGRHRDLADHLPEPGAVAAAGDLIRRGADHRPGGDLPARRPRRPDGQRAERRHPGGAGLRRRARTTRC